MKKLIALVCILIQGFQYKALADTPPSRWMFSQVYNGAGTQAIGNVSDALKVYDENAITGFALNSDLLGFKSANHTDLSLIDTDLLSFKSASHTDLGTINTTLGSPFQAGGSIGNTAFIANAGSNLNTSALNLETTQSGFKSANHTDLGTLNTSVGTGNTSLSSIDGKLSTSNTNTGSVDTKLTTTNSSLSTISTNTGTTATNTGTVATNQTSGGQKSQRVDGSGNVSPAGDTVGRKIFVQPTDGTNSQGYTASSEAKVSVTQPIPAGTNLVGKVGIDQTTPGTTNGVQINAAVPTGTNSIGQVTANAGSNLNTSLLTLQSGANSHLDKNGTGTISALNGTISITPNGMSTLDLSAQGTFTATLQVQGQAGDNAWTAILGYVPGSGNTSTVLTGASNLIFPIGGFSAVRVIAIAYTSGTANLQYNLGTGTQGTQVFNLVPASLQATVIGSGTAGTPNAGVVTVQGISGGQSLPVTTSIGNSGTLTQTSVSCATSSTTLLAGSTATHFIAVRNPTSATATVWINISGSAAVAAAPSIDLAPGSEADFTASENSYLPSSQINCISGGGSASTLTLFYK